MRSYIDLLKAKSQEFELELNLSMDGHRIGSFPHGVHFKGGLAEVRLTPAKTVGF